MHCKSAEERETVGRYILLPATSACTLTISSITTAILSHKQIYTYNKYTTKYTTE
jgi:hypothetical protein